MKTFRKILIVLAIIIVLLLIIAYLLPKEYTVARSVYIKSKKEVVYDLTSHFNKWDVWTPWTKKIDSTAVFVLTGRDGQVGTKRTWNGKVMGQGEMILTALTPGELVAYDLSFQEGKYKSKGKITIEVQGDSNKVTWYDQGDLGYNPISRYMGLFMGRMLGPDFEKGLAKLKTVAEERVGWPKMEEKSYPDQIALLIRDSSGPETYQKVFGRAFGELYSFIKSADLKCTGAPFAIYLKWDSVTMHSVMDIGFTVESAGSGKGRIRVEKIPAFQALIAHYFGPYEKTAETYRALHQSIMESGREIAGPPWEIYITDPSTEKDPMKVETDILFPVK